MDRFGSPAISLRRAACRYLLQLTPWQLAGDATTSCTAGPLLSAPPPIAATACASWQNLRGYGSRAWLGAPLRARGGEKLRPSSASGGGQQGRGRAGALHGGQRRSCSLPVC
eukprot:SAG31_NODE_9487_length_1269_cov_1.582906_2_plen_111_part_01